MDTVTNSAEAELPALQLAAVDRRTLALFAGASGDDHPLHIDIDYARAHGFDDVFAHGMLVMAWLGRLLTDWMPQSRLRSFDVRFTGITQLGDVLTCTGTVVEREADCVRVVLRARNQHGQDAATGSALVAIHGNKERDEA